MIGVDKTCNGLKDSSVSSEGDDFTDDEFLGGALKIYQSKSGFRSGIDAVLLAASVPTYGRNHETMRVLEAGSGAGVVSLAVAKRNDTAVVEGIEIEQENVDLARKNISRNDLQDRVQIHLGDLCEPITKLENLGLKRNSYDFVIANPPFYNEGETRVSSNPLRLRARRALVDDLENWVRFLTAMAAPKGVFSMIHRAERLDDLFKLLHGRFGGLRVLPIYSKENCAANRVLIQGVKGSRAPLKLLPGLVLHDETGGYVPEVKALCESLSTVEGPLAGLFQ
ncbi:MAG: tRNA1(Val) (adenine(37)-N6)-methyltransferase [Rhodomicrobiaceae bacterium]